MQRDVKIGIAIGVLLIALIGIFWWVRNHQPAANENEMPPMTNETMAGPTSPVAPANGGPEVPGGTEAAGGSEIAAPGATATTLPGAPGAVPPGGVPPVTPPTAPAVQTHTVVSGDSLAKISKQYYGTEAKWKLIADANQIVAPYTLKVGKSLTIPPADAVAPAGAGPIGPGATPPAAGARTHKVVTGDTLTTISRKYYGDTAHVNAIYQANKAKMSSPNDLKVGMVLTIP